MSALFKIMVDPVNCNKEEVTQVFMKRRHYEKGRYYEDVGLAQDEEEEFMDADAKKSTYVDAPATPLPQLKWSRILAEAMADSEQHCFPRALRNPLLGRTQCSAR